MILLVDAYNVLKRGSSRQQITQGQREAFIARLAAYAAKRNHEIIAVFDGGDSSYPINERQKSVRVIFSGDRMTADDVLQEGFWDKVVLRLCFHQFAAVEQRAVAL